MGSLRFDEIVFLAYTKDHEPPNLHAVYGSLFVILSLLPGGGVVIARRSDAYTPRKPKWNEVRRVLRCARLTEAALRKL